MRKASPKKIEAVQQTRRFIVGMLEQGKAPALIRHAVEMAPCERQEKERILQELHLLLGARD